MTRPLRLAIVRHAKSAWDTDAPDDHARPLAARGRRDAPRVGAHLAAIDWRPDVVVASDSARTRETFDRMRAALGAEASPLYLRALYHGSTTDLRAAVRELDRDARTALLLVHSPGCDDAIEWLTGATDVELKTADAALLTSAERSWKTAVRSRGRWALAAIVRARSL